MVCKLCGAKIGKLRGLWDRDFCSRTHREESLRQSARALKDSEFGLIKEYWTTGNPQPRSSTGQVIAVGLVVAGVMLVGLSVVGPKGGGGGSRAAAAGADPSRRGPTNVFAEFLSDVIPRESDITRFEDFGRGMRDWVGSARALSGGDDWISVNGIARPGSLRLWTRSLPLQDYRMLFEGSIQRSSLGWAYRATDVENYYSSRIRIDGGRVEIVRTIVEGGRQAAAAALPIPPRISPGRRFRVGMSIQGDRFLTFIDGQQVDEWTDERFRAGGVGFFADPGAQASLHWVSVTDTTHPLWKTPIAGVFLAPPIPLD